MHVIGCQRYTAASVGFGRASSSATKPLSRVCATPCQRNFGEDRRHALLGGLASLFLLTPQEARAAWDGSSSAYGSCAIGEEGADCRRQLLLKDKVKSSAYPQTTDTQEGRPQALTTGIPVSEMNDAYTQDTIALGDVVTKYFALDAFDPERSSIVKTIKTDGAAWASKYARGGSARKLSARKFYIVVDALQGHITSNGFAPLPNSKVQVLQKNVAETRDLLSKGS